MGGIWLHDLPQVFAGLPVTWYPGWETRSRSSGGYDGLYGIAVHHTASSTTTDRDTRYQWVTCPERPVGAMLLGRAGEIFVGAAGATNCQGVGGPRNTSKGTIPANRGNQYAFAIEAANNGVGEPWPDIQQDNYIAVVQRLCNAYGFIASDVFGHREWTTRKIDPAGPSRWGTVNVNQSWNMDLFRNDVAGAPPVITPPPVIPPPSVPWYDTLMQQMPVLTPGIDNYWFVKRMQHLLAAAGFMNEANVANYDGKFGNGTANALNNFKAAAGGGRDSTCDSWTWGALMHTVDGIATITKGMKGSDVKRMQHLLASNGYMDEGNTKNYDGVWGNGTEQAKINYDNAAGLTPSPPTDCGKKSWTALLTV
jgi:hypothetical protein